MCIYFLKFLSFFYYVLFSLLFVKQISEITGHRKFFFIGQEDLPISPELILHLLTTLILMVNLPHSF